MILRRPAVREARLAIGEGRAIVGAMTILFCHGLESGPHGRKFHALVDAGFDVRSPDCRGRDLAERVVILRDAILAGAPSVVVGSSFGGIAGLLAADEAAARGVVVPALVLLAPALHVPLPGGRSLPRPPAPTVIVHGVADAVVPIAVSRAYAAEHGVRLVEVEDEHALARSLAIVIEEVGAAAARGRVSA